MLQIAYLHIADPPQPGQSFPCMRQKKQMDAISCTKTPTSERHSRDYS